MTHLACQVQVHKDEDAIWEIDRRANLCFCDLSSSALGLGLAASAISLLQPSHSCLADLGIANVEGLNIIGADNRRELDL